MRVSTSKVLEQHIAVFGESGSGKTVMLSSFYGRTQETDFKRTSLFDVVADDIGQGSLLHRNYLEMRDESTRPATTRFRSTSYSFSLKLKHADPRAGTGRTVNALRLVWHDYPGDWFEQEVSGPEEAKRRVDTFRSLLCSDVALLLVDGQKLLDNAGEEERYLRSLLGNLRNALLNLKDDLLVDGKRLVEFPRIWILGLSKADLLPDLDVVGFRDLMIKKASGELAELRNVLGGMVEASEAMAVGEDYLLLSSARFDPNKIDVTERIGVDLVVPLAAVLPFERHLRWLQQKKLAARVAELFVDGIGAVADVLMDKPSPRGARAREAADGAGRAGTGAAAFAKRGARMAPGLKGFAMRWLRQDVIPAAVGVAARMAGDALRAHNESALARHDYMAAVIGGFVEDLEKAELHPDRQVLLRSLR